MPLGSWEALAVLVVGAIVYKIVVERLLGLGPTEPPPSHCRAVPTTRNGTPVIADPWRAGTKIQTVARGSEAA